MKHHYPNVVYEIFCRAFRKKNNLDLNTPLTLETTSEPNQTKELPEPWYWTEQDLNEQLASELSFRHILYEKKVQTLARRGDNDDVLFRVFNSEFKYAVVHLSWSGSINKEGHWPTVQIYKDWDDLYENRIKTDNEFYQ
ncbi:hypothetical protein GS399_07280 [Pedobacter sp. HMF7647]|uniref:Uncharacterized protein n=1 Tax=Hufsiella arboris TaxID=2695275 RepID=A0A7K1Y8S2_9SPHI|nr:hypothetical protein [Hufsiella arboris]MXV50771.1 hypothetical protein [Hufsiella arboris]